MKITDRKEYIKHRNVYRSLNNFLMITRLITIFSILVLFVFATAYSFIGKAIEDTYQSAAVALRWLIYIFIALWIILKLVVVHYRNNLKSAKLRLNDIVDEV